MARMVQIRHVPDDIHRKLKARAALSGMSLSEYLLAEVRRTLERPTRAEMVERLARRRPVKPREAAAEAVRAERDHR
jgi:plasmid stability protein